MRFTTAAALVNELVEAKHKLGLRRVMARWSRYDLIAIDEVGYVPLAEVGAEFLFQVVGEARREGGRRADHKPAVFRVDAGHSQRTAVQSVARPHYGSRSHPGDGHGIISIPPHRREAKERSQTELTGKPWK